MSTEALREGPLPQALAAILGSQPEAMRDPFPTWERVRDSGPCVRHSSGVVLVGGHADVKRLIRDSRLSSSSHAAGTRAEAILAGLDDEHRRAHAEISSFESKYVSRSDGEQHQRLRSVAHRAFTPRRIAQLGEAVERYTEELLGGMPTTEPVDFMTFAYRLPLMVIADMLGVPDEQRETIHRWSNELGRNRGGDDPDALLVAHQAVKDFRHYVEDILVPLRNAKGGTDLLTALLEAEEGERLTGEELSAMFVILLFAGHETTTNLLSLGLLELHRNPEQWRRLCAEPGLASGAVEELLRWVSPVQWLSRVALEDLEVDGFQIRRGETVFPVLAAANRDSTVFENADQLDIVRADAKEHLALGFGQHFCLGNALARLEGRIVFGTLARRYPQMQVLDLAPGSRGNAMLRGIRELRIVLDPGG